MPSAMLYKWRLLWLYILMPSLLFCCMQEHTKDLATVQPQTWAHLPVFPSAITYIPVRRLHCWSILFYIAVSMVKASRLSATMRWSQDCAPWWCGCSTVWSCCSSSSTSCLLFWSGGPEKSRDRKMKKEGRMIGTRRWRIWVSQHWALNLIQWSHDRKKH